MTKIKLRELAKQVADNDVPAPGTLLVGLVKPTFELGLGQLPTGRADLDEARQIVLPWSRSR